MVTIICIKTVVLLLCCAWAAYTDFRYGKVDNGFIAASLIAAIILDIISAVFNKNFDFALFAVNSMSFVVIAAVLYAAHILAGGDCKLLLVIALLYPEEMYWHLESSFSLLYMMELMFLVGFVYLLGETIFLYFKRKDFSWKPILKAFPSMLLHYAMTIIYVAAFSHMYLTWITPFFTLPNVVYSCLCLILVWKFSSLQVFTSKILVAAALVFDILMVVLTGTAVVRTVWSTYVIVLAFMIVRIIMSRYDYQTIDTKEIKKGMVLSRMDSFLLQNVPDSGMPGISDESLKSRLTEEEAESIRSWSSSKDGKAELCIVRKIPFAMFVFGGLVIYLIVKGCIG